MARTAQVQTNEKRKRLTKQYANKRAALKALIMDKSTKIEDRFTAVMKLSKLPRNSSAIRIRNRCMVTGRPRGYYRKFQMSRIALREMASYGLLPGVTKASW
jgi:small subunit ribosomal protein S14